MILCCGEALIDLIPVAFPDEQDGYVPHTGGAIFNTSIALGRLGVDAALLSGVSSDRFGQLLVQELEDNHVKTEYLIRSDRLSTLAVVHLKNGSATYSFYDENSAGSAITTNDLPAIGADVAALYFGGISLVAEPAADAFAALLEREKAGRLIMLDPNIRPSFIKEEISYRRRLEGMIANSDIVKVSDEDLDWLFPDTVDQEQQVDVLRGHGPSIVIVTQGAEGATAYWQGEPIRVSAPDVKVVDTVGAGDTFNAGILAGLDRSGHLSKAGLAQLDTAALKDALALGAAVAAVTVSRAGANPPTASEVGI